MFYGKSVMGVGYYTNTYYTRKTRRHWIFYLGRHSCNPGKKNKIEYHRKMRRGKYSMYDFKNSQWKKLHCTDPWNWC